MSIVTLVLTAESTAKTINMVNEIKYMLRRPNSSEKDDHHKGKMDMDNMYKATDKFVMVSDALKSREMTVRAAVYEISASIHFSPCSENTDGRRWLNREAQQLLLTQ